MTDEKFHRYSRWLRRKAKHTKDHNSGKQGMVGGNPRYAEAERVGKPASPEWSRVAAKAQTNELLAA